MARFGFVGPSYTSQAVNADCQKTQNWYPEILESQGKSALAMYPTPGLSLFATLSGPSVRGLFPINGRCFGVSGTVLYELFSNGTSSNLGAVATDGLPVSMTASASQLVVASGGTVYVFNLQTSAFAAVPAATFQLPFSGANGSVPLVAYSDGFFLALVGGSNKFYVSDSLNALSWVANGSKILSTFPDNVVSMIVDHREAWFCGQKATEVEYDSGNIFPYDTVPGGYIEQGAIATFGISKLDNSILWLGGDDRGQAVAWRAQGYTPQRISNHAVENAWQGYTKVSDMVSYSYQDRGHSFWVLFFPSANAGRGATWVYDVSTQMWHERAFLNVNNGQMYAHPSQCHAFAFGKHLVGDWNSGKVYQMDTSFQDDAGTPIVRVRRAPHIATELERMSHFELIVEAETGLGLQGQPAPQATLRWSNDGGHTWSNGYQAGAGTVGQFKTRLRWSRLGQARDRVYEFSVSDPVPWRIVDAYINAQPGYAPTERIVHQYRKSA